MQNTELQTFGRSRIFTRGLKERNCSNVSNSRRDSYFPLIYKSDFLQIVFTVSGFVWLGGLLVLLTVGLIFYHLTIPLYLTPVFLLLTNPVLK